MAEMASTEILLEITKDNLETGLRGYPVGYCTTSSVDPQKGLFYVGHPVSSMTHWDPEKVIYLLYHGQEGTNEQVSAFASELRERSPISPIILGHIRQLPKQTTPTKLFCIALLILGSLEGVGDYREDALNLVAKLPELAACVINYHAGWGNSNPSKPELGYMENFAHMLKVPNADKDSLVQIFRLFNILHYDHGGGNLSAFTGKAVSSGLEDLYGSLTGAMCALAGPKHGRANQDSLDFINSLIEAIGEDASDEKLTAELERRLSENQLIFGFGHAVLRVEDPRATVLYELAQQQYANNPLVKMALTLRRVAPKILGAHSKAADPYPNVDAISGSVLSAAGFPYSKYFTVLFGLARCVGISRQIIYERLEARDGKGVPIYRPKFFYLQ